MFRYCVVTACLLAALFPGAGTAARIKEIASLEGVRDNQLVGYGLVVGLAGTGDRRQTQFSAQSLANLLQRMGVTVTPTTLTVKNTAAVMISATLPPFSQPGSRVDVTVSSIGDAATLQGGLLVMAGLRGPDGQVYAMAQGPVVTGGFIAGGRATGTTVNHPTVGRIPNGAIVERAAPSVTPGSRIRLQLHQPDFTTAARVAEVVNKRFGPAPQVARAENSALVSISLPVSYSGRNIEFVSELENLAVEADRPSRVVINERTGTIVMGKEVKISPVAIMHGNLTVEIQTNFEISQPGPFSQGTTQVVPQTTVNAKDEKTRNIMLKQGATVEELVRALSAIGSTARDIVAILQNLRASGALEAEVEVI